MATTFLKLLRTQSCRSRRGSNARGFTLLELLIVTVIAGGLVSGLMYLVVELLTADQRDSSRNATQQDMQRALDYMGGELREAVYVYPGECLGTAPAANFGCPGLLNYLPTSFGSNPTSSNAPVLAFWRQKPLPQALINQCSTPPGVVNGVPCITGHSYALVVYSLNRQGGSPWTGAARITRYELSQFSENGTLNAGYVSPFERDKKLFQNWPFDTANTASRQTQRPTNSPVTLTDFVDNGNAPTAWCPDDIATVDNTTTATVNEGLDYSVSSPANNSSFYACISLLGTSQTELDNQGVILNLRGNAFGRPGIRTVNDFKPNLSTRVLSRGMLDVNPAAN